MAPEKKKDEQAMEVDSAAPAVDKTAAANNLKDGNVVARYKDASQIVNSVLVLLLKEIQPGKKIYDLCQLGDQLLNDTVNKQFKNAKFQKGALPTCINVNNTVEHFSPSNEDTTELRWDDVVKVELALHLDGYVATVGHTLVLNEKASEPITGPLADAICAAHMATELVIRKMKVGVVTSDLTSVVHQVASAFHSTPVEGTTISAHKKFVLGATPESFTLVPSPSTTVKLEANNVYSIFVPFSTVKAANATKTHPSLNPHLYARDVNNKYNLKLKTSKDCLKWIEGNASSVFPFPTRALQEIPRTRAGLPELVRNGVVSAVPIKVVSSGGNGKEVAKVAGFRTMVLLTENGVERVTGTEFGHPFVKSEYSLTGDLQTEFARNVKGKVKVNAEAAEVLKSVKPAQDVVMG